MQGSTEGDSIYTTSCWGPRGRGTALLRPFREGCFQVPAQHGPPQSSQPRCLSLLRKGRPDVGDREGTTWRWVWRDHEYEKLGPSELVQCWTSRLQTIGRSA